MDLIAAVLQATTDEDSIILDSFGGSGTTAHAVLKQNAKDGGNRTFILIEMMDYAETVTAERVRRVMMGYPFKGKEEVKLPVIVENRRNTADVIASAIRMRNSLELRAKAMEAKGGRYIRPIVLLQA